VLSSPCPWQSLAAEALGEGLRIIRLGKAEHHEVGIVATEVIWPRRDRQAIREPAHSLVVHNAAHLVGRQRDVVRPLAAQVCKVDLALARHRRCTAISRQASTCTPSFTSTGRPPLNVSHYS